MRIRKLDSWLGIRNSTTRLPFRYGKACLTRCPQAICAVTIEVNGAVQTGFSGDCLPPSWFDKSPRKDYPSQIADMVASINFARDAFQQRLRHPSTLFDAWWDVLQAAHEYGSTLEWPGLLATFGVSVVERACLDALARSQQVSFHQAIQANLPGIEAGRFDQRLRGLAPADWLPAEPLHQVFVRHTVGLADPLTEMDLRPEDRLEDGEPHTLEDYVRQSGVRYFKVKVGNQLDTDLNRLSTIAELLARFCGDHYAVTLDGNEQYRDPSDFETLIDQIRSDRRLAMFWRNMLLFEQPLPRDIALDDRYAAAVQRWGQMKPVMIDESDESLDSFRVALECGYCGVSSKNCKGPLKSLLNAGLIRHLNMTHNDSTVSHSDELPRYVMTGEDLCSVGIVPVQADLCLAATLGLRHVERNGHHYHSGLAYLPAARQQAALAAHGDLYHVRDGVVRPNVRDGRFHIGSLQCRGFGFAVTPVREDYVAADEWQYDSLGLNA
jgi:L-alanine-DL-glutamate epimerase-like enolase superfamily enzyme